MPVYMQDCNQLHRRLLNPKSLKTPLNNYQHLTIYKISKSHQKCQLVGIIKMLNATNIFGSITN